MSYTTCAPAYRSNRRGFQAANLRRTKPSVNILNNEDGYEIQLAIPGFSKEDILIESDKNTLTVKSKIEEKDNSEKYQLREFSYKNFERSFTISKELNQENISATMKHGILKLSIPFVEKIPAKQIIIK